MKVAALTFASLVLAAPASGSFDANRHGDGHHRHVGFGQTTFDFHGPEWWASKWRREHRELLSVRRQLRQRQHVLLHQPSVVEAINLAAATYGYGSTLWRKARCESGLNRFAHNPSGASGLLQFLPSTWASTPYAGFSVYDPYANALAAGWMHAHGRGGEWSCQ